MRRSWLDTLRSRLKGASATIVVVAVLFFASTSLAQQNREQPVAGSGSHQVSLASEVRQQLALLPWVSPFDNLQYRVDGKNVTLSGQVTEPIIKDEAVEAVQGIEDAGQVTNHIEVLPPSAKDESIRQAEYAAIYNYPELRLYSTMALPPIHIVVKGGQVTLDGTVANQADRAAAEARAKSVPNVSSVTDNLQIVSPGQKQQ
jgi:osmotically-inducible protein OsmY